ncbi:MAG: PIG-L family deacetylase, partial [Gemmatimonadales bacterium]|nr:PIG-L family deacetylase [Candidatus Palauibacter denitrificans]
MIDRRQLRLGAVLPVAALATLAGAAAAAAQSSPAGRAPDRVLAFPAPVGEERLDVDRGAMGAWHRIRKLGTTASLLHVTAHPDDEHAGMLTLASRGWGARTALLSLNRGEAGANAIGPELFDALGLIRTRELVLSGRYYGLDDLYFTTAVDYGYSKSVYEAFRSWDREAVLEDMVRVIRLNRPLVVVSRFHGSARDGHGHHHAAGLLTPEAAAAAADATRFPRQISEEGLRPWRVLRTFRGGVRVDEPYDVAVNAAGMSPWLGDTYQRWASRGLGLQRSQTAGRVRTGGGRYFYERLDGIGGGTGAG